MNKRWIVIGSTVVLGGLGMGCGQGDEQSTAQTGYRSANVVEQASARPSEMQSAVVTPASSPTVAEAKPETELALRDTALPPDVLAKVSSSVVTRGETVDVIAEGSPDVVEMLLSDGSGTTQNLVFDAATGTWRASYRVPLKTHDERLGLSIRAKNGGDHWRRVWVFLTLPENAAKVDSTSQ